MSEQNPPQLAAYIIRVTCIEEYHLSKEPKRNRDFFSWLFNINAASGAMTGGRYTNAVGVTGGFDHSTVATVLDKVDGLRAQQQDHLEYYSTHTERKRGYDYTGGICAEIWVGPADKLQAQPADNSPLPEGVKYFRNADITAGNLKTVLELCNTAETRAQKAADLDKTITRATAPVNVKPLKILKVRKPA